MVSILSKKHFTNIVLTVLGLAFLNACTSSSGGSAVDDALNVPGSQTASNLPKEDDFQDPRAYCPKTVLREGTETYDIYPTGVKAEDEGASDKIRYRATISEVVRECNSAGQYLNIKVGVRGRYLSGPGGETGAFSMPLRVAVTRGSDVLYSELHQIPAEILPGRSNGSFTYVDKNISILRPDNPNILIYVGYDEGPYDTQ